MRKSGFSGHNLSMPSGAGTKNVGIPAKSKTSPSRGYKNSPGDQTEDTGDIRKSKAFKGLMNTLQGKTGTHAKEGGRVGKNIAKRGGVGKSTPLPPTSGPKSSRWD